MKSIYRSKEGEKVVYDLYDRQVISLGKEYNELFIQTRFGKTHVLQLGNPQGKPILLFHGGNSTAAFSLKLNRYLIENHLVYAPDTIGHPGKSDQRVLSSSTLEYGEWASDVIDSLGFEKIICMGESFGGGVLAKLMCISPEKILKAILLVPAGISNASKSALILSMGIPMLMYMVTKKEKWFEKSFLPMTTHGEPIDKDTMEMIRIALNHVRVNSNMPSNISKDDITDYHAPTLLLAGENDILFPAEKVIARAKEIIPNLEAHLLKDCGHLYYSSEKRRRIIQKIILDFISK